MTHSGFAANDRAAPPSSPPSSDPRPASSLARPRLLLPALLLNLLIASGTFLVAKETLREFPPLPLAAIRILLATALLWPAQRLITPDVRIAAGDRKRVFLLGLLGVALNQGLFLLGMRWASVSHAALLYALTPSFVVLFGMGRERRPTLLQVTGIALAFAGVFTLLLHRGLHFETASLRGDLIVFVAVISWALYFVLGRDVSRRYGSLPVTAQAMLGGALAVLPFAWVGLGDFHPAAITLKGWLGLLYLAWLTSGLNYVIWFWGLQHLKPATVALITNLQPIVAVAMAWVFLREPLPAGFVLSTALVLGGVWLTQWNALRATAAALGPSRGG